MHNDLKNFLENLNIFFDETEMIYFEGAKIIDAEFSKTSEKIKICIKLKDFLPINILKYLEDNLLANNQIPCKLSLVVENQNYNQDLIWNYIEYIKDSKAKVKTGAIKTVCAATVKYFKEYKLVKFLAENQTQRDLLIEHKEYYKNKLIKYGFKNIDLEVEAINDLNINTIEEVKKVYEQASKVVYDIEPKKEVSQNTFKNKFRSKKSIHETPSYERIVDLEENAKNVTVHGEVISKNFRVSRANRNIYTLIVSDGTSSITCTYFCKNNNPTLFDEITEENKNILVGMENEIIRKGDWISVNGNYTYSTYDHELIFYIDSFQKIKSKKTSRIDDAKNKRVELHTHTKMSVMDGVSHVSDYIKTAKEWNWKAIAITDHLNVQSFPDAFYEITKINRNLNQDEKLKLIYGSEIVVIEDDYWVVKNPKNQKLRESKFVVFDLETTGLSPEFDEIIEFGANVYDYAKGTSKKYDILIKPKKPVSSFTTELTNITNEMLEDKNSIEIEFKNIMEIIQDGILIAHNANFDFNFLQVCANKFGYGELTNTVIDTLTLARLVNPQLKNHRLGSVAKEYGILYDEKIAHRADYDAEVLTNVFEHMWSGAKKYHTIDLDSDWNKFKNDKYKNENSYRSRGYHINVLAKNQAGIKDLYKIISLSHTKSFLNSPKIFKSELLKFKDNNNILIGSGCVNGQVFENARTGTFKMLRNSIKELDYIEIQPLSVYTKLIQTGDLNYDQLKTILKKIIKIAKEENKIIVATSDSHYVNPETKIIRDIYINTKGLGGKYHPLYDFKQRVKNNPDQHLRTTNEMLEEFKWLEDSELIYEIVVTNPNLIANQCELDLQPIKSGSYPPKIENADVMLKEECYKNAKKMYGQNLPEIVEKRLEKELHSIIKHGFAVVYWISHLLVKKSHEDGYLVGSRGSVGSSFVATVAKITEVNPLKPHYRCKNCQYSDFNTPLEYKCGYDLPEKFCPNCNEKLIGDGHDIPFETFLGFDGDKVPDVDLNFSGDYQPVAHNFTKEIFGENNVFRAGTISTVAAKTAFGYTLGYFEKKNMNNVPKAEIERLAELSTGVKRTTGQHPGGIIILPKEYEIEDFTPVNFPADDNNSDWLTTHFDFHSIHDNLLKMDILGHVDPTALRMLQDLTGVDPITIPTDDKKVYSLFSNLESLGLNPKDLNGETTGAIGLPEFGTAFVKNMLKETQPKTFADLVQISGLSHGTDVYVGNAQNLIKEGVANISTVIGCRDDIMVYLMNKNLDASTSFAIMESVRKGNGLKTEWIDLMKQNNVPEWYINSCLKIKYMFPKAHATAYVLMAYRVAWFKLYYPEEYYATWFTTRADFFDIESVVNGKDAVKKRLENLKQKINDKEKLSAKETAMISIYEVIIEMFERNITIKNIDFNISDAMKFKIIVDENNNKIIYPPFNVLDSLGEAVANSIVKARENKQIVSVNDLKQRTQVTQTHIKMFENLKITKSLRDDEQLSFNF
ncbi:DNA polymerase III subunit alpha (PolC) [Spiroplasma gladiatoris]|uniref:DNA polymerase III PolC-type n=1 Tax=Spiroplasma gladiatoris TaxID=2143 RepID=A0A4P7AI26_9MOLU|nr:PolC-type DNA polymerase III [Spiroplasma gladiatoris]QBQ07907.1 DNA polymerase III subunit alpha (PolC) [Spiroplasma gladiatoris]